MSEEWNRRSFLKSTAAAGVIGFAGGSFVHILKTQGGTRATLNDAGTYPGLIGGKELDLRMAAAVTYDGTTTTTPTQQVDEFPQVFEREQTIQFSFDDIGTDATGRAIVAFVVCDTPSDVTVRVGAKGDTDLADAIEATLWREETPDASSTPGNSPLYTGTLTQFLPEPVPMAVGDCVGCQPLGLGLEWEFTGSTDNLADTSLSLALDFQARQCDNREESQ
ncbi:twin-arginine translocation signal domain-containing protein [Halomicroarcula sp. F13]|uniref:Twin-arginine translocation signal domain-containing protein n=1 Tax=Haloarcula rubra TaxID=2487747 RepID=A0AAW4PRW8_9EURY|nr:twin-arginine translocation signal domain-containing protein [Halomicroarcula rubra]MBX0324338.1 twin-arginine translocation signal domain-containing protein [Halomicroarcula rubra]